MKSWTVIPLVLLALVSCAGGGKKAQEASPYHDFAPCQVPAMCSSAESRTEYMCQHFWDKYLAAEGPTDSIAILGVPRDEVEQAFADYLGLLEFLPMQEAQKCLADLFCAVEAKQASQEGSLFFLRYTEMMALYLYDPNSPMRCEDYFLPVARGLASSAYTREDMRPGYVYQARMCAINQYGQKVPDFGYKDIKGRTHRLYDTASQYTLLFFSNPGCPACGEILEQLTSRPYLDQMISEGLLTVVSMYIDQEIDKWAEYEPNYPRNWVVGYDHRYIIRTEQIYDVRAIPSLYLLDSQFRVVMKDAPTEKVLRFFDRMVMQQ